MWSSYRERTVRGTGECKINRGYMIFKSALLDSTMCAFMQVNGAMSNLGVRVQASKENFRVDDDMLMRHSFESEHILE